MKNTLTCFLTAALVGMLSAGSWAVEKDPVLADARSHAALESSGCAYMVSVMIEESAGVKASEVDVFALLFLHGDPVRIREQRGFNFYDIKQASAAMGLRANAYRSDDLLLDLAQRKRQHQDGPYLLLKDNPEGVDRFYLYYSEDDEYVYLRDPFAGMVTIRRSVFNRTFVPYVLIIEGKLSEFTEV